MTGKSVDGLTDSTDKNAKSSKAMGMAAAAAKVAIVATGVAAVAAAKYAITSAADYEQSLNIFASVAGATAEQMKLVAAQSRALGKDISLPGVSAADAALAMTELAKAGLSVNDSMAASKGVLSLAKAGQMETAQAAEIAGNALMAFGLKGEEANRVADLLAAAANASSAGVHDLGISLSQASAVAAMTKRPVEDVVTQLSLMANAGLKGSDAGTSVKSMLMALISPSSTAAGAMKEIGFNAYTAGGQLKSTREIIQDMTKALNGKTDAQKNSLMADIFGSDGIRAASIVMKDGVEGYDKMRKAVTKQGASADLAAAQNAGFKGALDALKSSVETVGIDLGMKMLPALTGAVTYIGNKVEPTFNSLVGTSERIWKVLSKVGTEVATYLSPKLSALWSTVNTSLIPSFVKFWDAIQPLLPVIGTVLVVAFGLLLDSVNLVVAAFSGVISFVAGLVTAFNDGNPIVVGLALAFGSLALAMGFNAVFGALTAGFATLTTTTIPGAVLSITGLKTLITTPIIMPAIAIAAALIAIQQVANAYDQMKSAIEEKDRSIRNTLAITMQQIDRNARIQADHVTSLEGKAKSQDLTNKMIRLDQAAGLAPNGGRAIGSVYAPGGRTLVGEHGPEYVDLPQGSKVTQAYRTRNELSSGGGAQTSPAGHSVYIKEVHNHNDVDVDRMIRSIGFKLATA